MLASIDMLYEKNDELVQKALVTTFIIANNLSLITIVVTGYGYIEIHMAIGSLIFSTTIMMYLGLAYIFMHQYYTALNDNSHLSNSVEEMETIIIDD